MISSWARTQKSRHRLLSSFFFVYLVKFCCLSCVCIHIKRVYQGERDRKCWNLFVRWLANGWELRMAWRAEWGGNEKQVKILRESFFFTFLSFSTSNNFVVAWRVEKNIFLHTFFFLLLSISKFMNFAIPTRRKRFFWWWKFWDLKLKSYRLVLPMRKVD